MGKATQKSETDKLDDLLNRIGDALADETATSEPISALADEVTEAIPALRVEAERLRKKMLDPGTTRADIAAARASAETADLDAQRFAGALVQLETKLLDLFSVEEAAARLDRYQEAEKRRNDTAQKLLDLCPTFVFGLAGLIEQTMEVNEMVDRVNEDLPDGAAPLHRPEGYARGFHDHGSYDMPVSFVNFRITQAILPNLKKDSGAAWPPVPDYGRFIYQKRRIFRQSEVQQMWKRQNKP